MTTSIEDKIIKARCDGISFCEMADWQLRNSIDQIMLRGAAIAGCALPQTDFFAGFIAEEFIVFINEFGFSEFTLNEILLALRINSRGGVKTPSGLEIEQVAFTGVCINVDYLSKILSNYCSLRNYLDRKFENKIDGY